MIRLGARLAVAGGRGSVIAVGLTAVAVALGTAVLLFALSFEPAFQTRYAHIAWRDTASAAGLDAATADRGLLLSLTDDRFEGRALARLDVAALSADAPVPPGLSRIPGPGESYVSPALEAQLARTPSAELGDRFGRILGTMGDAGLKAPDELAAVVGLTPQQLRVAGSRAVLQLDTEPVIPPISPIVRLLVLMVVVGALTPVAVFVGTSTRLSAARREQRLALLRLLGATPIQVYRMAAGEALAATVPGALLGVLLFWLLRPVVALVPLDSVGWFPDAIAPGPASVVGLLLLIQVVGAAAAIVALRRVSISPLGVTRRHATRPLRRIRLAPLGVGLLTLVAGLLLLRFRAFEGEVSLYVTLAGFFGIIVGIAVAGPWLTMVVGRTVARVATGASALLASRRLIDDPRSAFGAIAGVVMGVFVAAVFFSVAAYARAASDRFQGVGLVPAGMHATVPAGAGQGADDLAAALRTTPGVRAVAVLRDGFITSGSGGTERPAAIGVCSDLVRVALAFGDCSAPILGRPDAGLQSGGTYTFLGAPAGAPASPSGRAMSLAAPLPSLRGRVAILDSKVTSAAVPAVLISPSLLPEGGRQFAPTQLLVATDGSPTTQEVVRTRIEVALPTANVRTDLEIARDATAPVDEVGRIVVLGLFGTMLMAGCSLAVATASGLLERRRPFALLRLTGMPLGSLRSMVVAEAAAPLAAAAIVSAVLGLAVGQIVLQLVSPGGIVLPDASSIAVLVAGTFAALSLVGLALPLLGRITATESTRFE